MWLHTTCVHCSEEDGRTPQLKKLFWDHSKCGGCSSPKKFKGRLQRSGGISDGLKFPGQDLKKKDYTDGLTPLFCGRNREERLDKNAGDFANRLKHPETSYV
jgi:hypothetical protein